jgi:deoxyribodipyrimidine photo-lyase
VRHSRAETTAANVNSVQIEPALLTAPPAELAATLPDKAIIAGRDVWLVHPWNLGELPAHLPADALVVGLFVRDFHCAWPWSDKRWRFVTSRMAELCSVCWYGDAAAMGVALKAARRVSSIDDPHLTPWLSGMAACEASPALFSMVKSRCDSFSQWWTRATRGLPSSTELLASIQGPAW